SAATTIASGGKGAMVFVEIGAGDLKASIELAKKGVRVIAVDPVVPAAEAIKELEAAGGTFIKGTAEGLSAGTADQVVQNFPWRIGGAGRSFTGGTWRLVTDAVRILKPNGVAHIVTEDFETAEFLAKETTAEEAKLGIKIKTVITETLAGPAAPGASGSGVPNFS